LPSDITRLPKAAHCDVTVRYDFMAGKKQKGRKTESTLLLDKSSKRGQRGDF
jgi:hypothetical protein